MTSFANKMVGHLGDPIDTATTGFGYTCRKSLKPESPNQDSYTVLQVESGNGSGGFSICGVFDGHGQKGHDVSHFVQESLPKLIVNDKRFMTAAMPAMLKDCFLE